MNTHNIIMYGDPVRRKGVLVGYDYEGKYYSLKTLAGK